jgi:hypothetical protein
MKNFLFIVGLSFFANMSSAQNVGIGTTAPSDKLTVNADGIGITQESSNQVTRLGFYTFNGQAFVQTHSAHDLKFATNNGPAAVTLQKTTGNLGIGTTNPTAKLEVAGSIKIADGSQAIGKVLTSDASGRASWQATAYGNTERFSFFASNVNQPVGDKITYYNTGTATTTIFASDGSVQLRIAFSKAGLYHLSINVYSQLLNAGTLSFDLKPLFVDNVFYVRGFVDMTRSNGSYDKEIDLYVPANTTLMFAAASRTTAGSIGGLINIVVTGNLITE